MQAEALSTRNAVRPRDRSAPMSDGAIADAIVRFLRQTLDR
jgi:hypothetical protein